MAEFCAHPPPGDAPVLSENAIEVLRSRYLVKDRRGNCIETPAQLFSRVAWSVAQVEADYRAGRNEVKRWHKRYYQLMASLDFLPNSPALMNAERRGMLSACFVLPIDDSIEGIFETVKQTALIQKAGGGTGFSFDRLRPTGDRVGSSGGTTSGPISFWRVFSEATNAIQQGAFRRGANMGMMSVGHPDILKFLHAKQNLKAFTNFNISAKITDDWMRKLLKGGKAPHIVVNPRTKQQFLLPRRIDLADYTIDDLREITGEATNPCGEQPLLAYEACTLGSINVARFVRTTGAGPGMDWPRLAGAVALAVRFLDNIVDACNYPLADTQRLAQANRKIGLGVMGFADCLFALGIRYDSHKGVEFGASLMKFINDNARKASSELARLRGPFPNWSRSIWRTKHKRQIRNASLTCAAPTGTISIIADCSCGIEPIYSLVFVRQVLDGARMFQVNPLFKQTATERGFYSGRLERRIAKAGSIQKLTELPASVRRLFKAAYDIEPQWHIRMQAAFQKHCDAAVSKTINLDEKAVPAAIDKAYKLAYRLGCKGVTVYRRGSRKCEPMSLY
ncbi:MAG: ribonucleotide reductase N-terminal alpha domain-containing protein [Planctomycetota bacterium]